MPVTHAPETYAIHKLTALFFCRRILQIWDWICLV